MGLFPVFFLLAVTAWLVFTMSNKEKIFISLEFV